MSTVPDSSSPQVSTILERSTKSLSSDTKTERALFDIETLDGSTGCKINQACFKASNVIFINILLMLTSVEVNILEGSSSCSRSPVPPKKLSKHLKIIAGSITTKEFP